MSRKAKNRPVNNTIAVIVDGKDEEWYLYKVKEHYSCQKLRNVRLVPELPQKKKVKQLFALAQEKLSQEYTTVFLIIDFDEILKKEQEYKDFCDYYKNWHEANSSAYKGRKNVWMKNLHVIINSPCLEYWFLLHFKKTSKFFQQYLPELRQELRSQRGMEEYEKTEKFYMNNPDIYQRLEKFGSLQEARNNAVPFSLETCKQKGGSELYQLFDYFDKEL